LSNLKEGKYRLVTPGTSQKAEFLDIEVVKGKRWGGENSNYIL